MNKDEILCRLDTAHKTRDGDFIPKGTPVRILRWSPNNKGLIRVEATAHSCMDSSQDEFGSSIGYGMLIDVDPNSISFISITKGEPDE